MISPSIWEFFLSKPIISGHNCQLFSREAGTAPENLAPSGYFHINAKRIGNTLSWLSQ